MANTEYSECSLIMMLITMNSQGCYVEGGHKTHKVETASRRATFEAMVAVTFVLSEA